MGDTPPAEMVMGIYRRKHSSRPSQTTGNSHWTDSHSTAATAHRPRDRHKRENREPEHQDEMNQGTVAQGEATYSEADESEIELVGNEYMDGQIEMKIAAEVVISPGI